MDKNRAKEPWKRIMHLFNGLLWSKEYTKQYEEENLLDICRKGFVLYSLRYKKIIIYKWVDCEF